MRNKVLIAMILVMVILTTLSMLSLTAPLVSLKAFPERSWTFDPGDDPVDAVMDFFPAMTPVTFKDKSDWADDTAALRCEVTGKVMFPQGFMCWPHDVAGQRPHAVKVHRPL